MNKIFTLIGFVLATVLTAQNHTTLTRTATHEHEHYGWSVDATNDWVVVGSPHSNVNSVPKAGKVDIYQEIENGVWDLNQSIVDSAASAYMNFGQSVAIFGNYIAVGATGTVKDGPHSGMVILFHYNGTNWEQVNEFTCPNSKAYQWFGNALAMNKKYLVIGAYKGDGENPGSGEVYVVENYSLGNAEIKSLATSSQIKGDHFGFSIAINDANDIVVGAPDTDGAYNSSGAAYTFIKDNGTWTQVDSLGMDTEAISDQFGISVGINKESLVVGSLIGDGIKRNTGVVISFEKFNGNWTKNGTIRLDDGDLNDYFGACLDLDSSNLIIGAPKVDGVQKNSGACYVYEFSAGSWNLFETIIEDTVNVHNYFGTKVALAGEDFVVTSQLNDVNNTDAGEVYIVDEEDLNSIHNITASISTEAFPMPVMEQVTIKYGLVKSEVVSLYITDLSGKKIKTLLNGVEQYGTQNIQWDLATDGGDKVAPGTYFYTLEFGGSSASGKLVVK